MSETMSEQDVKKLEKSVKRAKRIATEWASQLHDLVEDRLPAAFEEIPQLAQSTYDACKEWRDASDRLEAYHQQQSARAEQTAS